MINSCYSFALPNDHKSNIVINHQINDKKWLNKPQNNIPLENHASEIDRGLVLLQVDGLSYNRLKEAMKRGYAPNLKKMLESNDYQLGKYSCGLPSLTVPVLCSMFYGMPLVAQTWYDVDKGKYVDSIKQEPFIQEEAAKSGETGLLSDGTIYSSALTGGSSETYFNVSQLQQTIDEKGVLSAVSKEMKKDLALAKKGNHSIVKMTYRFLKDFFKFKSELKEMGEYKTSNDRQSALLLSLNKNVILDIATEGIKNSIERGLPVTYVDYGAYDDVSHYYGVDSEKSLDCLKLIDNKVGEIVEKVEIEKRPYDVLIFSDHGQVNGISFAKVNKKTIQQAVVELAKSSVPDKVITDQDIIVCDVCSMAGIYFTFTDDKALSAEIEKNYPGLIRKIIDHPSIGFTVTHQQNGIVIEGKDGKILIDQDTVYKEGKDPLDQYGDSNLLIKQIKEYSKLPKTGDILIFGAYDQKGVIDFNSDYTLTSVHGGAGGDQTEPFIIYGRDINIKPDLITSSVEFHNTLERIKKER